MLLDFNNSFRDIENISSIAIIDNPTIESEITIGIPTYKRSQTLAQTIESVFGQLTQTKFNIIVSDSNSERNDQTEQFMSKYSAICGLKYYKHKTTITAIDNWNKLLLLCKTKYLVMIHDDDVLLPQFLDAMLLIISHTPKASFIKCASYKWEGDNSQYIAEKEGMLYHLCLNNLFWSFYLAPTGCLIDVCAIKNIGGFDKNASPAADYVTVIKLLLNNKDVYFYDRKLIKYRVVGNATSLPATKIRLTQIDVVVKTELGSFLKIPTWYIKFVIIMKQWLCNYAIKKIEGGKRTIFDLIPLIVYKLLDFYEKKINRPTKIERI